MARNFDVILWGASGFTGNLVAKYFAVNAPKEIKFALAGRSEAKLKSLKAELIILNPSCENVQIFSGLDTLSASEEQIDNVISQTKVVLSTAGPFMKYGLPVVHSCVKNRTHYCDITGESTWVRTLIDRYHDEAENGGVHIVPMCGFDSIPFDLGVYALASLFKQSGGCKSIKGYYSGNGRPSGGTLHTMIHMLTTVPLKKMTDYHLLSPPSCRDRKISPQEKDQKLPKYDRDMKQWTSPFIMSGVNTRVVRRSKYILEETGSGYGENFYYEETELQPNFIIASLSFLFTSLFFALLFFSISRALLVKVLPKPGEGPSEVRRAKSHFSVTFIGKGYEDGDVKKLIVRGGDPGYSETAKMVSNAAITLAIDAPRLPLRGGVLTPATSMGHFLVSRLQHAGLGFEELH